MPTFAAPDGTALAYRAFGAGSGEPVVCLPGGPMRAGAYLGDLGGLAADHRLLVVDLRGTGESARPADPESWRCDRQVADVEALRIHLGLDRFTLLGHSAGASLALSYAAAYPDRIDRLALVTPSARSVALDPSPAARRRAVDGRSAQPWFATVSAAYATITDGRATRADWAAVAPLYYGRWDTAARAHHATEAGQRNAGAARVYNAPGAFDALRTRAALGAVTAPVLVVAGELDWITPPDVAKSLAALFPAARLVVLPGVSHYPWLDDPVAFTAAVGAFLG